MTESSSRIRATIDLRALKKNLSTAVAHCPDSQLVPVVKANAYGHGLNEIVAALTASHAKLAALAVATLDEALQLQALGINTPVLLLSGFSNKQELELCLEHAIEPVIHSEQQLSLLDDYLQKQALSGVGRIWLKHNTGMNRLGLGAEAVINAYHELHKQPETDIVLMSHLACADDPQAAAAAEFTRAQLENFASTREQLSKIGSRPITASLAASAGILNLPASHHQLIRPGLMLYGASPLADQSSEELGLLPVMTLSSRLIAINEAKAGASIGYGATYTCQRDTRIGVVAIGYADGYPRSAVNGTPVLVKAASGEKRTSLIGRVSMDMITIDLTGMSDVCIGDEVVLWGKGLPVEEVAQCAATVSYELFCKLSTRVSFEYS